MRLDSQIEIARSEMRLRYTWIGVGGGEERRCRSRIWIGADGRRSCRLLIGKAGRAPRLLLVAVVAEWEDEWARQARAPRDNKGRDQIKLKRWARGTSALCLGVWTGCMGWQTAASAKNDCILSVSALWLPSLLFRFCC